MEGLGFPVGIPEGLRIIEFKFKALRRKVAVRIQGFRESGLGSRICWQVCSCSDLGVSENRGYLILGSF